MSKNLLIGESLTQISFSKSDDANFRTLQQYFTWRKTWKTKPYVYVELMRQLEIFNDPQDNARLNEICVTWHDGINLLPPNFAGDNWEYNWARLVAKFMYDRLLEDYDIVYVAGRRSAEAFGLKKVPFCMPCRPRGFRQFDLNDTNGVVTFVPIPSPSQNSKWWFDENEVTIARHSIQNLTKRIALDV